MVVQLQDVHCLFGKWVALYTPTMGMQEQYTPRDKRETGVWQWIDNKTQLLLLMNEVQLANST